MDKIYTVKEAAKLLEFSTNTVYKYLEDGTLEAARGAGKQARFRIPHSSIEKYLGSSLSEDTVLAKLDPEAFARRQELAESPTPEPTPTHSAQASSAPQRLPLTITRVLILAALVFIILDLVLSRSFTLTTQLVRMAMIAVFVLLAYQFGGYQKA
jgi:excisionase family DNA binding protein